MFKIQQEGQDIETGYASPSKRYAQTCALQLHAETMDEQEDIDEVERVIAKGTDQDVEDMAGNFDFEAVPMTDEEIKDYLNGNDDDDEDDFPVWIDVPNPHCDLTDPEAAWVNVQTFDNREEAIEWAKEHLGADDQGRIQVVTGGDTKPAEVDMAEVLKEMVIKSARNYEEEREGPLWKESAAAEVGAVDNYLQNQNVEQMVKDFAFILAANHYKLVKE